MDGLDGLDALTMPRILTFLVVAAMLTMGLPAAPGIASQHEDRQDERAGDQEKSSRHAMDAGKALDRAGEPHPGVEMTITPSSDGRTWSVDVNGRAHAPAPAANLTVGPWQGKGNQSAPVDNWKFNLTRNETFTARLEGPSLPPGQHDYHVQFAYRAEPFYQLNKEFRVHIDRTTSSYTFDVAPVLYTGDEGNPFRAGSDTGNLTSDLEMTSAADSSTTTLTGKLWFIDPTGVWRECWFCHVRVWDSDSFSGDDSLGWFKTAWDGSFSWTMDNGDASGGIDPYFVIFSRAGAANGKAEVFEVDGTYHRYETGVLASDCPDSTCTIGRVEMDTNGDAGYGYLALHGLNKAWFEFRWDADGPETNLGLVVAVAPDHNAASSHFHPSSQEIHLHSDETSLDTIVHEYGHFSMYQGYNQGGGDWWFDPDGETCTGSHTFDIANTRRCGWSEGWADFVPLWVWTEDKLHHRSGTWWNAENWACYASNNGTWYADCADRYPNQDSDGDDVEGRVAASLMDLWDPGPGNGNNDGESYDYSFQDLWVGFTQGGGEDHNFRHYCRSWETAGYSEAAFRDVALTNTIDYGTDC